jgi:hypothetical protein
MVAVQFRYWPVSPQSQFHRGKPDGGKTSVNRHNCLGVKFAKKFECWQQKRDALWAPLFVLTGERSEPYQINFSAN